MPALKSLLKNGCINCRNASFALTNFCSHGDFRDKFDWCIKHRRATYNFIVGVFDLETRSFWRVRVSDSDGMNNMRFFIEHHYGCIDVIRLILCRGIRWWGSRWFITVRVRQHHRFVCAIVRDDWTLCGVLFWRKHLNQLCNWWCMERRLR